MHQKKIIAFAIIFTLSVGAFLFIGKVNAMAADCAVQPSGENYIGVKYKALLAEDQLPKTGWLLLFCGSGFTMNGEYQPHFIDLMIKSSWASLYDDALCAAGFPPVRETRKNFTIQFGLSDYEDSTTQDNDIAAWSQDPQLFPRMFTNIDNFDPEAPDKIMAEYQVDRGGTLEGREIEVSFERGEITRLPMDKNYFMDPDNGNKPNSQADILYREWTATLTVPSLGVNSSVYFYINASQGDKLIGTNTLNILWESPGPGKPAVDTDKFKVIIFDPQVKTLDGKWRNATNFTLDIRTPLSELAFNEKGQLVAGYRQTFYKGFPAIETSFGYGRTDYILDKDPTNYEPSDATKALIDLLTYTDKIAPFTVDNYDGLWHTSDFTIGLNASDLSEISGTYYRINNGSTQDIVVNGYPRITLQSDNDTLEYWSVDGAGNEELPHKMLAGIKLDKNPPTGSILINNGAASTTTTSVTLTLSASDTTSGVAQMRFSNNGITYSAWQAYSTPTSWTLQEGDGVKTVYVQFKDNAELTSTYSDTIALTTTPPPTPTPSPSPAPSSTPTPSPTPSLASSPSPSPATSPSTSPSSSPPASTSQQPTPTPTLQPSLALPMQIVYPVATAIGIGVAVAAILIIKRRRK